MLMLNYLMIWWHGQRVQERGTNNTSAAKRARGAARHTARLQKERNNRKQMSNETLLL